VDRDGSSWSPDSFTDVWPYYDDVLGELELDYDYHEVLSETDDGPDVDTMMEYDIIIWFCGEVWSGVSTLTVNDEQNLSLYIELTGGKLFLSAQDYLWDVYPNAGVLNEGEFPYEYFGLREVTQDVWNIDMPDMATCQGSVGGLAEGMEFEFQDLFTEETDEGLFVDDLFDHVGMSLIDFIDPEPTGVCAIQYEEEAFRTVFTTASFACIEDFDVQVEFMQRIIVWLMGWTGMEEMNSVVNVYPNPLTTKSVIELSSDRTYQDLSLELITLTGKSVNVTYSTYLNRIEVYKDNLAAGTYMFTVVDNKEMVGQGKLIVY